MLLLNVVVCWFVLVGCWWCGCILFILAVADCCWWLFVGIVFDLLSVVGLRCWCSLLFVCSCLLLRAFSVSLVVVVVIVVCCCLSRSCWLLYVACCLLLFVACYCC